MIEKELSRAFTFTISKDERRKAELLSHLTKTEFYGHREPGFFHGRIFDPGCICISTKSLDALKLKAQSDF